MENYVYDVSKNVDPAKLKELLEKYGLWQDVEFLSQLGVAPYEYATETQDRPLDYQPGGKVVASLSRSGLGDLGRYVATLSLPVLEWEWRTTTDWKNSPVQFWDWIEQQGWRNLLAKYAPEAAVRDYFRVEPGILPETKRTIEENADRVGAALRRSGQRFTDWVSQQTQSDIASLAGPGQIRGERRIRWVTF